MAERPAAAVLDSNVIVAAVVDTHEHHAVSAALFSDAPAVRYAIAAHSFAEAYATLTRRSASACCRYDPTEAWHAITSVAKLVTLLGLSPSQTFDTIRSYAEAGGIGARLYDRLIGEVAVLHGIPRLITWNVGHFQTLFPELEVMDPGSVVT